MPNVSLTVAQYENPNNGAIVVLAIAGIQIEGYSKSLDSPKESIRPASGGMIEPNVMYYHTFNQS
jgi:hypothetical protein